MMLTQQMTEFEVDDVVCLKYNGEQRYGLVRKNDGSHLLCYDLVKKDIRNFSFSKIECIQKIEYVGIDFYSAWDLAGEYFEDVIDIVITRLEMQGKIVGQSQKTGLYFVITPENIPQISTEPDFSITKVPYNDEFRIHVDNLQLVITSYKDLHYYNDNGYVSSDFQGLIQFAKDILAKVEKN